MVSIIWRDKAMIIRFKLKLTPEENEHKDFIFSNFSKKWGIESHSKTTKLTLATESNPEGVLFYEYNFIMFLNQ
jgi:hypothetical protein